MSYENDVQKYTGRDLILIGVRADADIKHRDKRIAELEEELLRIKEAAGLVVAQRHNVASGYELFARVNVLLLSRLAEALGE